LDTTAGAAGAGPVTNPMPEEIEKIEPRFIPLAKPRLRDDKQPQKRINEPTIRVYRTVLRNSSTRPLPADHRRPNRGTAAH